MSTFLWKCPLFSIVLTMVSNPEAKHETKSFPARAQTMVLCAPLTAGPWSAVTIRTISKNLVAYFGKLKNNILSRFSYPRYRIQTNRFRNQSKLSTPPMPISSLITSVIGMPAYNNSWPRSSTILVIKLAGFRIKPSSWKDKSIPWLAVSAIFSSILEPSHNPWARMAAIDQVLELIGQIGQDWQTPN